MVTKQGVRATKPKLGFCAVNQRYELPDDRRLPNLAMHARYMNPCLLETCREAFSKIFRVEVICPKTSKLKCQTGPTRG